MSVIYHESRYLVIAPGTTTVLGSFWTADYDYATQKAAQLGGIVTNHKWLLRQTGIDYPFQLGPTKQEGPRHEFGSPKGDRNGMRKKALARRKGVAA